MLCILVCFTLLRSALAARPMPGEWVPSANSAQVHPTDPPQNAEEKARPERVASGVLLQKSAARTLLDTNLNLDLEPGLKELLPRWDWSLTIQAAGGFDDNVALSCCDPEASPFVRATVEAVGLRLPVDGNQVTILFTGEDTRFFSSETVDHEDLVIAQGEFRRFWANDWETAFGLEGVYLDQVVDLSITETNRAPLPVRGATFTARPAVKRNLSEAIWLSLEVPLSREYYNSNESLDDYWQVGPKVMLARNYGNGSEIGVGYEYTHRRYDTEPALAVHSDGLVVTPIPGLTRASDQHEVGLVWRHQWDAARRWRSTTRVSFRRNTDNGGGYYDYDRWQVGHQIRFRTKVWEASAEARVGFYDFPVQTVDPNSPIRRERTDLFVTLRLERKLGKHVRLFAQYEREATDSNRAGDEYAANTVLSGVGWEF